MSRRKMNWDRVRIENRSRLQDSERVEPDQHYKTYLAEEMRDNAEPSDRELDAFWDSLPDHIQKALMDDIQEEHPATKRNNAAIERFLKTGFWNP